MSKFMPKINSTLKTKNGKNIEKLVLTLSLLPPIPAKLSKEVNNLNKFFKNKTNMPNGKEQVLCSGLINRKCYKRGLKIKEMFLKLQASKIKNIQKIIYESNKLKPCINMIIKSPSYKQVIIPINNENKNEFMKNSSNHIISINRLLKNIKFECKADYIRSEKSSVVIVPDKITSALDLQTIEQYCYGILWTLIIFLFFYLISLILY